MNLIDKAINDYNMIGESERIVVGLSGGADSVCLTHYLKCKLNLDITACHINHNLRGEDSKRDEEFVKDFCKKYDIKLFVFSEDVKGYAELHKLSLEEAGRDIRYQSFFKVCKEVGANKIATAHTLSDSVETMLFNMTRQSSLKGLCGIPAIRDNIIRPLIYLSREQVEEYCKENSLSFVTDKTNFENDYSRNKIRNLVIPVLREINANFNNTMSNISLLAREDEEYFSNLSNKALKEAKADNGYDVKALNELPLPVKKRTLALILKGYDLSINYDLISKLCDILNLQGGKINIKKDTYLVVKNGILEVIKEIEPLPFFEQELRIGGNIAADSRFNVQILNKNDFVLENVYRNLLYLAFDYDKIEGKILLRQKKPKDKIKLAGSNCTKTLKKLYIEKKLTAYEKSSLAVVQDENGVIGVMGIGVDDRVKVCKDTKKVLVINKIS